MTRLIALFSSLFFFGCVGEPISHPDEGGHTAEESAQAPVGELGVEMPADGGYGAGEDLRYFPYATFELVAPTSCESPCVFRATVDVPVVESVRYSAEGWPLGESRVSEADFAIKAPFFLGGRRLVKAEAISRWGTNLGSDSAWVDVRIRATVEAGAESFDDSPTSEEPEPEPEEALSSAPSAAPRQVPYFYQYANALAPEATCQNTSIAMVLASLGWRGAPDDITREFGRRRAQSPHGLAQVFNVLAARAALSMRLAPTITGSVEGLREELDRGRPVIVHGYTTRSGHVLVVLGYDQGGYFVHDPAGRWNERFQGGYLGGDDGLGGREVYYDRRAFEAAIATSDGHHHLPLWYHSLR